MRHGWRCGRDWRSFWWCCRSTWSATACATRSIQGSGEELCVRWLHPSRRALVHAPQDEVLDPLMARSAAAPRVSNHEALGSSHLGILNHRLPHHAPAIHLEFEINHGRPGKMPGQTGARGATANQFIDYDRMKVMEDRK